MSRKKKSKGNIILKVFTCLVYLVIMVVLFIGSFELFKQKQLVLPWSQIETVDEYTYMDIDKMSEQFASYENNIGLHFATEENNDDQWHTYIIAIDEKEISKYQALIDYTYERIDKKPDAIRVYGYPIIIDKEIKSLAIKNISNFVPADNKIEITEENYESYLTNSYLDTTIEKKEEFSITACASFLLVFVVFGLMILTILDKNKKEEKEEETDA